MRPGILHVLVVVVILVFVGYLLRTSIKVPHHDPLPSARITLEIVRKIDSKDIETAVIQMDEPSGQLLVLKRGSDDRDIELLLNAIKHARVPERENDTRETDRIGISTTSHGGVSITGRFDPTRAPVVSASLCSDDLGRIIQGIFERRGIRPRQGLK